MEIFKLFACSLIVAVVYGDNVELEKFYRNVRICREELGLLDETKQNVPLTEEIIPKFALCTIRKQGGLVDLCGGIIRDGITEVLRYLISNEENLKYAQKYCDECADNANISKEECVKTGNEYIENAEDIEKSINFAACSYHVTRYFDKLK